eukprot:TCONS_00059993-protein
MNQSYCIDCGFYNQGASWAQSTTCDRCNIPSINCYRRRIEIWSLNTERRTLICSFDIHPSSYIEDVKQRVSKKTGISFKDYRLYRFREDRPAERESQLMEWHPLDDYETIDYHYSNTVNYGLKVNKYMMVENKAKISIMSNTLPYRVERARHKMSNKNSQKIRDRYNINCISTFRLNFLTKTVELKFKNFRLIRDVKIHIQKEFNIRVGDQVLIYKGKKLMENQLTRDVFLENQINSLRDVSISLVIEKKPFMLKISPQIRSQSWFSISINDSDNIEEVKQQIQAETEIPIQNIHLIDQKMQDILCDTKKVEEYKFLDQSVITLQQKLSIRLHFAKDNRVEERVEILPEYEKRTVLDLLEEIRESFLPKEMNVEEIRYHRYGTLITRIYEIDFRIKKIKKCSIM